MSSGYAVLINLLGECILKKELEKAAFLKEFFRAHIFTQNETFLGENYRILLLKYKGFLSIVDHDYDFFLELFKKVIEQTIPKGKQLCKPKEIYLRILNHLYYLEGDRKFKKFLKWIYLNDKTDFKIKTFANYISSKKMNRSNFSSLLLYMKKPNRLSYCFYVFSGF